MRVHNVKWRGVVIVIVARSLAELNETVRLPYHSAFITGLAGIGDRWLNSLGVMISSVTGADVTIKDHSNAAQQQATLWQNSDLFLIS